MRVEIRDGGDGVECWNSGAIHAYADQVNAREGQLAQRNPDLVVLPGAITCFGCESQEYGYGTKCTAQIVKTTYAVNDEIKPRPADAAGWHREIPGLQTIAPDTGTGRSDDPAVADAEHVAASQSSPSSQPATVPHRGGLRGLFNRGS